MAIPDPLLVLEVREGTVAWRSPEDVDALARTPDWAKPVGEAALSLGGRS